MEWTHRLGGVTPDDGSILFHRRTPRKRNSASAPTRADAVSEGGAVGSGWDVSRAVSAKSFARLDLQAAPTNSRQLNTRAHQSATPVRVGHRLSLVAHFGLGNVAWRRIGHGDC